MENKNKILTINALILAVVLFFIGIVDGRNHSPHLQIKNLSDVDELADALKEKILNSPATLIISGTKYYVSNSGNDANNGKSPVNAWATLKKVSNAGLKKGDAILFERGGTWRGSLKALEGISYSAYGSGPKPRIFGSLQNYSIKNKWVKTPIANVYVYDEIITNDAGLIVFKDGEANSVKKVKGIDGFTGALNELKNDLEMYHNTTDNKIYICSTHGNPADRFSSIEFGLKKHIIQVAGDNVSIDNLCIKYGGSHGIGSGARHGLKITNCELGWIGGSIHHAPTRYGNAIEIYGECSNYTVDHCYIYQIYDTGITHQYKNYTSTQTRTMENVTYTNNLIEKCIYSIEYFLDQPKSEKDVMKNILIKDNICRLAGYGWGWQRPNKVARHIQGGWLKKRRKYPAENFTVTGNIFDRSKDVLLSVSALKKEHLPVMSGNVYIQEKNGYFGFYGIDYSKYYPMDTVSKNFLKEMGIDQNPVVIRID
jgi:hypothetical protein